MLPKQMLNTKPVAMYLHFHGPSHQIDGSQFVYGPWYYLFSWLQLSTQDFKSHRTAFIVLNILTYTIYSWSTTFIPSSLRFIPTKFNRFDEYILSNNGRLDTK